MGNEDSLAGGSSLCSLRQGFATLTTDSTKPSYPPHRLSREFLNGPVSVRKVGFQAFALMRLHRRVVYCSVMKFFLAIAVALAVTVFIVLAAQRPQPPDARRLTIEQLIDI